MFRFSIREMMLVTLVVALVAGWWVEHRRQAKVTNQVKKEAAYQEWKNRVLEQTLLSQGTKVQADGESITLTGKEGTSVVTPTSHIYTAKNGNRSAMTNLRPKSGKTPDYYYPPARTSPR